MQQPTLQILLFFFLISTTTLPSTYAQLSLDQYPSSTACKNTIYPKLCLSILRSFHRTPGSPPDSGYGKFTIKQCLKQTIKLSKLINHFLTSHKRSTFSLLSSSEVNALVDCAQLADFSVDYLDSISGDLKSANSMSDALVYKIQALLSAVVTNHQTCFDGLKDAGNNVIDGSLLEPFSEASGLYSVSLGLVSHALKRTRKGKAGGNGMRVQWAHQPTSILAKAYGAMIKETPKVGRRLLEEMDEGGVKVQDAVTVSLYGGGNFTSIGEAIEYAPSNSTADDGYFVIYVQEGYYEEYLVVSKHKKNIMLLGDGINHTVIAGNRSVYDGWTTFRSATFAVSGERFVAIGITFQNLAGPYRHQAVAVRNNADLSTFYRCSFIGYQDTLYVHSLRQFYRECDIYGTVDFIFGNAAAVFQNCNLYARKPMPNQKNAITAQSRSDPNQDTGISIQNCTISAAPDLANNLSFAQTFLGRPWKPYSRTVYMESFIGNVIDPAGWLEWNATASVDNIYYGEYANFGPGSETGTRVQWPGHRFMNATDAFNFTVYNFTMGDTWLPYTNIPFSAGLE